MANDDTIPTIAELKGNTILELLSNVYTTLKNAIFRKQNKLIAGDNIVITDDNVISAIEGGSLDDYYTKEEVNGFLANIEGDFDDVDTELDTKADADTVYTTSEVDALVSDAGYKEVTGITPSIVGEGAVQHVEIENLQDGDIIDVCFTTIQTSTVGNLECKTSGMFVFKTDSTSKICNSVSMGNISSGGTTIRAIISTEIEPTYTNDTLILNITGKIFYIYGSSSISYGVSNSTSYNVSTDKFIVLRRA